MTGRCNCPPPDDVFRHPVYTKDPCPVHDDPKFAEGIKLLPAMQFEVNLKPLRGQIDGMFE